jgi:hypothetical protein
MTLFFAVLRTPPVFRRQLGSLTARPVRAIWGVFSSAGSWTRSINLDGGFKAFDTTSNGQKQHGERAVVGGVFGNIINNGLHQELNTWK